MDNTTSSSLRQLSGLCSKGLPYQMKQGWKLYFPLLIPGTWEPDCAWGCIFVDYAYDSLFSICSSQPFRHMLIIIISSSKTLRTNIEY